MKKFFALALCIVMCFATSVNTSALISNIEQTADHSLISTTVLQDWYRDAYKFVIDEFLMTESLAGYKVLDDGYEIIYEDFHGNRSITRSEIAVILSRYNGSYDTVKYSLYVNATCPAFVDANIYQFSGRFGVCWFGYLRYYAVYRSRCGYNLHRNGSLNGSSIALCWS